MSHTGIHLGSSNLMSLEPSLEMNIHEMSLKRWNRFRFHNNDTQNYGRNGYDGQDRNAYNAPERDRDIFDRGIDLEERNIGGEPNLRPAQGQDLRNRILEVIDQALDLGHRKAPRHPYRKPYPERIDGEEWPRGFKAPDFTMFSEEDEKTTLEYIYRFTIQCGEYPNNGNGKLRLFPNSLTGQAFTWYAAVPVITPFLPTGFSRVSARKTGQPGPSQHDPMKPRHIKYSHEEGPGHISQGLTKFDQG